MSLTATFQRVKVDDKELIVKRDDLLEFPASGNKAFKLYFLTEVLQKPHPYKKLVSYGGYQSNYMLALARIARYYQLDFDYHVLALPKHVKAQPTGSLKSALATGMHLVEHKEKCTKAYLEKHYQNKGDLETSLILEQGGFQQEAEKGLCLCAKEIDDYLERKKIPKASIVIASGTGASAYYLQKHLPSHYGVYTVACIGDADYLEKQFKQLQDIDEKAMELPVILTLGKKYHFGKCYIEHLKTHQKLLHETGINFDLLYDPIAWQALLMHYHSLEKPVIYIHCGGTEGNESMYRRYRYLNLVR